ncbi:CorA family divalent cation transporter [Streptomyces sp. NPDC060031]|uniref:CorA family divalent cation transporter n=1 Tax=Streptomyces sp. NPDC060031 TaxID=3347043 RepID=UPI003689BF13
MLKTIVYVDHEKVTATSEIVDTGEITVFAGPGYLITVRHGSAPSLDGVRQQLQDDPQQLGCGPAGVLHAVADMVVDRYVEMADAFAGDVDTLESEVFSPARPVDAGRIYQLKRGLLEFKRAVMPLASALQRLSEGTIPQIPKEMASYFRDVADHHQRVSEQILSFDELIGSAPWVHLGAGGGGGVAIGDAADRRADAVGDAAEVPADGRGEPARVGGDARDSLMGWCGTAARV